MKNYYEILGVSKDASADEIKKKYRELAKQHHPDKGGDENVFKDISAAYETLSDSEKRKHYDNPNPFGQGQGNPFGGGFSGGFEFNMNDIFGSFFGGGGGFRENLDINVNVKVPFKSIYQDKKVDVNFYRYDPCPKCDATGFEENGDSAECLNCESSGHIRRGNVYVRCNLCNGNGKIHSKKCSTCNGDKVRSKYETVTIDSVFLLGDEPNTISYRGLGNASKQNRGQRGNLNITLIPEGDSKYLRHGYHLLHEFEVDYRIAIDGGEVEYKHLDDKVYKIKIPAKSNKGSKFKLSGKGLLSRDRVTRGDLLLDLSIVIDYSKEEDKKKKKKK